MTNTDIFIKPKSHFHLDHHSKNIFTKLRAKGSILMNLYAHNQEILNVGAQAPSPSKNYCQLIVTLDTIVYRSWQISLHTNSDSRYPTENVSSYEDLVHDDILQRNLLDNDLSELLQVFLYVKFILVTFFFKVKYRVSLARAL